MKPRVTFALITAAVLLVWIVTTYASQSDSPDNQTTRYYGPAAAVSALFPIALVLFAVWQRIDTFSFGAIVFAVVLQAILYVGWSSSPQEEADWYFYGATALPLILIVVTLLFNALQKEA